MLYADGTGYHYSYGILSRLWQVSNLAGEILEAHQYDSQARATTSAIGDGQEDLTLYGASSTTVTDAFGNATVYEWATVNHIQRSRR